MKLVTPAERRECLKAFIELPGDELPVADRTAVEHAASCPFMAKAVADGRCSTVGALAESGEAVHRAFGDVLHSWIDSRGAMSPQDLRQDLEQAVRLSRPDIQPDAIRAMQGAVWSWSQLVYSIHPGNILAFDGGEDIDRSGQLAVDFPDLGVRYTSELDLLYQGDCPEVGDEVDYKTGWKDWTAEAIRDSFQFQSHAVMALEKYPQWQALRIRVFETRARRLTYGVHFPRERMHDWKCRIRSGIEAWRLTAQDSPPTWPTVEGCRICAAASICPVASYPISAEPSEVLRDLIAVEARASALRDVLIASVDSTGQEVTFGSVAFGRNKPKKERKAPADIYSIGKDSRDGD